MNATLKIPNAFEIRQDYNIDDQLSVRVNHEQSKEQLPGLMEHTQRTKIKEAKDCEMYQTVKIGKKLGEGAYGQVFQGLWPAKHKFIVVKKISLPEHLADDLESKQSQSILSEIQMLTKLQHDNIVKYYDSCLCTNVVEGQTTKEIQIYMEYMNQGSLSQLM